MARRTFLKRVSVERCEALIEAHVGGPDPPPSEVVSVVDALGRVTVGVVRAAQSNPSAHVAAMDGGLQLVLLWARGKMGGAALPMRIGEVRIAEATPAQGNIRCIARCPAESSKRGLADVIFATEAGVRVAEFKDVEVILRPNEATPVA